MSNARNLSNLLGTGTTVPRTKMPDGGVLQLVSAQSDANITTSNTSATAVSALTCSITPTESGNKIIWDMHGGHMSFSTSVVRVYVWLYLKIGSGSASNAHPSGGTNRWAEVHMDSTFGHSNSMRFVYTTTGTDALEFTPYFASSNGSLTTGINYNPSVVTCSAMEVKA
jgi:hypothetical protein